MAAGSMKAVLAPGAFGLLPLLGDSPNASRAVAFHQLAVGPLGVVFGGAPCAGGLAAVFARLVWRQSRHDEAR